MSDTKEDPFDPDLDFCSKCHEHTEFEQVDGDGEYLSVCCGAPVVEVE